MQLHLISLIEDEPSTLLTFWEEDVCFKAHVCPPPFEVLRRVQGTLSMFSLHPAVFGELGVFFLITGSLSLHTSEIAETTTLYVEAQFCCLTDLQLSHPSELLLEERTMMFFVILGLVSKGCHLETFGGSEIQTAVIQSLAAADGNILSSHPEYLLLVLDF